MKIIDFILKKRMAYRAVFAPSAASDIVINDLRKFCRGMASPAMVSPITQTIDSLATGIAIGRQEVWQRIMQNLHISDADLYKYVENNETGTE